MATADPRGACGSFQARRTNPPSPADENFRGPIHPQRRFPQSDHPRPRRSQAEPHSRPDLRQSSLRRGFQRSLCLITHHRTPSFRIEIQRTRTGFYAAFR